MFPSFYKAAVIPAVTVLTALFLFPLKAESAANVRTLKVGVAVTPAVKELPDWKDKFERRLAYASKIFENSAKIKFKPAAYWDWQPKTTKQDSAYLLDDLSNGFPLHGVDIVIGLTRLDEMPGLDAISDLHVIGRARPFSGYLIIRYPNNPLFKVQEETVMVHELGHLFGAIHTDDRDSIMAPIVDKQIPSELDLANREILMQTRDIQFKTGIYALDKDKSAQLIHSYKLLMATQQPLDFYFYLGIMYLNTGQTNEAVSAWEKASALDDSNSQIHMDLGILYSKLSMHKEAIRELTRAIAQMNRPWQKPIKAQALNALGESYLKSDNPAGAYGAFTRASAIDPENLDIQINLAAVQMKRGQARTAIADLKVLLAKAPEHPRILNLLGTAFSEIQDYAAAVDNLLKAMRILTQRANIKADGPLLFEVHSNLGNIYLRTNDSDQAIRHYQAACSIYDTVNCRDQLGKVYFQLGKWEDAAREYSAILQFQKDNANVYGALGVALSQMGQDGQAIGIFQEGLKHVSNPQEASRLHSNIGHLYLSAEQADFAEKEFRLAAAKDWKNIDSHIGMAMTQLKRSNPAGARDALNVALRLQPGHKAAMRLLADVNKILETQPSGEGTISITGRAQAS